MGKGSDVARVALAAPAVSCASGAASDRGWDRWRRWWSATTTRWLAPPITVSCEEAGLEVVAETDSGADAVELIRRFGVDVLVLDLSLGDGSGERTVEALNEEGTGSSVVVFTAYASDPWRLLRLGVREVIEKPDFELLQDVLAPDRHVASTPRCRPTSAAWRAATVVRGAADVAVTGRRVARTTTSPTRCSSMEVGDAVLAITIVGLEALEADVGPLLTADCRLAVAGTLREELRVQDLLHEAPEVGGFVALLRGGDARAAGAVWSRLTAALRTSSLPGEVKGAASRVDAMGADRCRRAGDRRAPGGRRRQPRVRQRLSVSRSAQNRVVWATSASGASHGTKWPHRSRRCGPSWSGNTTAAISSKAG